MIPSLRQVLFLKFRKLYASSIHICMHTYKSAYVGRIRDIYIHNMYIHVPTLRCAYARLAAIPFTYKNPATMTTIMLWMRTHIRMQYLFLVLTRHVYTYRIWVCVSSRVCVTCSRACAQAFCKYTHTVYDIQNLYQRVLGTFASKS